MLSISTQIAEVLGETSHYAAKMALSLDQSMQGVRFATGALTQVCAVVEAWKSPVPSISAQIAQALDVEASCFVGSQSKRDRNKSSVNVSANEIRSLPIKLVDHRISIDISRENSIGHSFADQIVTTLLDSTPFWEKLADVVKLLLTKFGSSSPRMFASTLPRVGFHTALVEKFSEDYLFLYWN